MGCFWILSLGHCLINLNIYFPLGIDFDADDPLGDLLLDEDEDHSDTKKNSDLSNSNVTESSRRQQSISDPSESKNRQNKAKVIAELFGFEDEEKQSQPSQRDRDSSSSWLGLKDHLPAESKTLEVVTASHKTPEYGTVCICVCVCVCVY
jgi:hypothetical protein